MPTPSHSWLAPLVIVPLVVGGCWVGPPLPVEEEKPNFPPLISEEFISPRQREVVIDRSEGIPQRFEVDPILDINESQRLTVYWFSGDNLLRTDTVGPLPGGFTLYRGLFTKYTGSSFDVDPCQSQWLVANEFLLTVFVADGDARFADSPEAIDDDTFTDSVNWRITFTGNCI